MPVGGPAFSSVRKAREALKEKAHELLLLQIAIIKGALNEGDFETAAKANQFLLEHIPADEDGGKVLDVSVDKKQIEEGYKGPAVNVSFQLGGIPQSQPALPEPAIEIIPIEPEQSRDSDN